MAFYFEKRKGEKNKIDDENIGQKFFRMSYVFNKIKPEDFGLISTEQENIFIDLKDSSKWEKRHLIDLGWGLEVAFCKLPYLSFEELLKLSFYADPTKKTTDFRPGIVLLKHVQNKRIGVGAGQLARQLLGVCPDLRFVITADQKNIHAWPGKHGWSLSLARPECLAKQTKNSLSPDWSGHPTGCLPPAPGAARTEAGKLNRPIRLSQSAFLSKTFRQVIVSVDARIADGGDISLL